MDAYTGHACAMRTRQKPEQDQLSLLLILCIIAKPSESIWLTDLYNWHALLEKAVHAVLSPVRDPICPLSHLYEHRKGGRRPPFKNAFLRPSLPRFIVPCRQHTFVCWIA